MSYGVSSRDGTPFFLARHVLGGTTAMYRGTLLCLLSLPCFVVACSASSGSNGVASTNGVDDVKKACAIRAAWQNERTSVCGDCKGLATAPRCTCTDKDYAGACSGQQSARTNEPTCAGVDDCIHACASSSDCDCVDRCYTGKDACRTRAAALDGCIADICDSRCR